MENENEAMKITVFLTIMSSNENLYDNEAW